jgi:hypothetical protein
MSCCGAGRRALAARYASGRVGGTVSVGAQSGGAPTAGRRPGNGPGPAASAVGPASAGAGAGTGSPHQAVAGALQRALRTYRMP